MLLKVKRHFRTKTHNIKDDATMSIRYRDRDDAIIFLMRKFILDDWSVIIIGDKIHYYHGIQDIAPTAIRRFTPKALQEEIKFPWIKGLTLDGIQTEEEILRTFMRKPYLTGIEPLMPDPNDRKCYYEISMKGSKIEKCFTEAFISGVYNQFCVQEPAQRIVVFAQAPFKPKTKMGEYILTNALENGLKIVYMFKGNGAKYDTAKYSFKSMDGQIYVEHNGRTYEVKDDTYE